MGAGSRPCPADFGSPVRGCRAEAGRCPPSAPGRPRLVSSGSAPSPGGGCRAGRTGTGGRGSRSPPGLRRRHDAAHATSGGIPRIPDSAGAARPGHPAGACSVRRTSVSRSRRVPLPAHPDRVTQRRLPVHSGGTECRRGDTPSHVYPWPLTTAGRKRMLPAHHP